MTAAEDDVDNYMCTSRDHACSLPATSASPLLHVPVAVVPTGAELVSGLPALRDEV